MANHPSAEKRNRQRITRTARNRTLKSSVRTLVKRLRTLTYTSVQKAIESADDPLGPLLEPAEIRALLARRDHLMRYIDGLSAELGENAVLALP